MLSLEDYRKAILAVTLIGVLIISSPALAFSFSPPSSERFSEFYVLGPNGMIEDYPFNVKSGEVNRIILGIRNNMGFSTYYAVLIKVRNESDSLPNSATRTPSLLPSLYEYHMVLNDGGIWQESLDFSFDVLWYPTNSCMLRSLNLNGKSFLVNQAVSRDGKSNGYFFELLFELWTYDPEARDYRYHNRFLGIWLNATESSL